MIEAIAGHEAGELERPALEPGHCGEPLAERRAAERGEPALANERRLRDQRLREHPRPPIAGELDLAHEGREARGLKRRGVAVGEDRKSTRLNSSHSQISYAVFCSKKKK